MNDVAADEWGGVVVGRVELALDLFRRHHPAPRKLLDVGCGVGTITNYLAEHLGATEVSGVDVSENLARKAVERGVEARVANLDNSPIPFDDSTFDAVFCGEVIEHVRDTDVLLDEIERVLTPDGLCVLSTPNLASWINRIALTLGWQPFLTTVSTRHRLGRPRFLSDGYGEGDIDHLHVFTTRSLIEMVAAHRLSLVAVAPYGLMQTMTPQEVALGGRGRNRLLRLGSYVDAVLSRRKSLAVGVVVAFRRGA